MNPKTFDIRLPESITIAAVKFDFVMDNDVHLPSFSAEICDEGGGAYLRLQMDEPVAFNPDELQELTEFLLEACAALDKRKKESPCQPTK